MIPRYTREEMGHIWSERNEFDTMLLVETLASEAQAELGVIPKEAAKIKEILNIMRKGYEFYLEEA